MKYADGSHIYEYRDVIYCPEDDVEEDNVKRFHNVKIRVKDMTIYTDNIPLSPYARLSKEQFKRWVQCNRPTKEQMGGKTHDHHLQYWISMYGEAIDNILLGK